MAAWNLLASYARGPRIWDAASLLPEVTELADAGLIEPVPGSAAYQLTSAGRAELARGKQPVRASAGRPLPAVYGIARPDGTIHTDDGQELTLSAGRMPRRITRYAVLDDGRVILIIARRNGGFVPDYIELTHAEVQEIARASESKHLAGP